MNRKPADAPPLRLLDIVTAIAVMAAVAILAGKILEGRDEVRSYPPLPTSADAVPQPIAAEANVFRVEEAELGVTPALAGDEAAHIRSLDMYRSLRAYPGAPPRIPHGLADEEYRRSSCNVCHLRGGWVARFGTYAPVTPHPEYGSCLQCHTPQDALVGRALPATGSDPCTQCHVDPDATPERFVEIDWESAAWPAPDLHAMPGSPNRVPHDFQTRNNCLACHSGPGAVVGLRTDHPERLNCRQCHVPVSEGVAPFPGPSDERGGTGGVAGGGAW